MKVGRIGIGVYGQSLESFLETLRSAGTETVIDIRRFRGLRGPKYRWANSKSLQASLKQAGIAYRHEIDLSPTRELRAVQKRSDVQAGVGKSNRENLSPAFIVGYLAQVAPHLTLDFTSSLPTRTAFLCVESSDAACHRSILLTMLEEKERA
jgi:uncharacterized protein (DUF488 family)